MILTIIGAVLMVAGSAAIIIGKRMHARSQKIDVHQSVFIDGRETGRW